MQAVDDFCTDSKLEKEEVINYKKQVADYCNEQIKTGDEVQVRELSGELPGPMKAPAFGFYPRERL